MDTNNQGILVEDPLLETFLKSKCKELSRFKKNIYQFPGSQPATLTKENIDTIDNHWMVAEKTDGTRYLLLIIHNDLYDTQKYGHTFLVDRKYRFYGLTFMNDILINENLILLNNTLLDGELAMDNDILTYYVFDNLSIGGTYFGNENFNERLVMASKYFISKIYGGDIRFMIKKILPVTSDNINELFIEIKNLPHDNDGLIFTNNDVSYPFGSTKEILKWKPQKEATVDFNIEYNDGIWNLIAFVKNSSFVYDNIELDEEQEKQVLSIPSNKKVIEAILNKESNTWEFVRIRPNKVRGNEIITIVNVLDSYKNEITDKELIQHFV